jgi:hypothetical protein
MTLVQTTLWGWKNGEIQQAPSIAVAVTVSNHFVRNFDSSS